jgi:hypothetical protein
MRDAARRLQSGEVRSVRIREPGTAVAYSKNADYLRTFAYVKRLETTWFGRLPYIRRFERLRL